MGRQTFIRIMVGYLVISAVLSLLMAPAALSQVQTITEVMHAAPMRFYVVGLLTTLVVIPAYAARLMDLAIPPFFAVLFLFPVCFNLAQRLGVLTIAADTYPHSLMNVVGLCNVLVQVLLMVCRGTKGPNRYGSDRVIGKHKPH
jgi:uncharacterized membrane protein YhaH (DUF805 family)